MTTTQRYIQGDTAAKRRVFDLFIKKREDDKLRLTMKGRHRAAARASGSIGADRPSLRARAERGTMR
jgi:hypothetical protein